MSVCLSVHNGSGGQDYVVMHDLLLYFVLRERDKLKLM